jgi:hypothetical protein
MKTSILTFITAVALALPALAAEDHTHEKQEAGPNGGRVLTAIQPHAEFFVTADRTVQITFLDERGKAIAPAAQAVTVTAGERSAPTKLTFIKSGEVLVSEQPLPGGNDFPTVVQIKDTPEAKAVVEKFNLNLSPCPGCKLAEYACICSHQH